MTFFDETTRVRLKSETKNMINELLLKHSDMFSSQSHVIRCAIIRLYNSLQKRDKNKQNTKGEF